MFVLIKNEDLYLSKSRLNLPIVSGLIFFNDEIIVFFVYHAENHTKKDIYNNPFLKR